VIAPVVRRQYRHADARHTFTRVVHLVVCVLRHVSARETTCIVRHRFVGRAVHSSPRLARFLPVDLGVFVCTVSSLFGTVKGRVVRSSASYGCGAKPTRVFTPASLDAIHSSHQLHHHWHTFTFHRLSSVASIPFCSQPSHFIPKWTSLCWWPYWPFSLRARSSSFGI
jgi:hypothetical protein